MTALPQECLKIWMTIIEIFKKHLNWNRFLLFIKYLAESGEDSEKPDEINSIGSASLNQEVRKKPDEINSIGSAPDTTSSGYGFYSMADSTDSDSDLHSKKKMDELNKTELDEHKNSSFRRSKSTSHLKTS